MRQPISIEYTADSPPIAARIQNLSESGAFIDSDQLLPLGCTIEFQAALPDGDPEGPIHGRARVIWSAPHGAGVEFKDLSDAHRKRLKLFVAPAVASAIRQAQRDASSTSWS